MLYDLIFIGILVLFTLLGVKKRASKTLMGFIVFVLSALLACLLSSVVADIIYDLFIRQGIVNSVNNKIAASNADTADALVSAALSVIPALALSVFSYFGVSNTELTDYLSDAAKGGSDRLAQSVADAVKAPMTGLLSLVLIIILFIVFMIVLKILSRIILKIFKLPVINTVDAILGGVFGFVQGIIIVIIVSVVLKLLIPTLSGGSFIFTQEYMEQSFIMSFMFTGKLAEVIVHWIYDAGRLII